MVVVAYTRATSGRSPTQPRGFCYRASVTSTGAFEQRVSASVRAACSTGSIDRPHRVLPVTQSVAYSQR
ncbi:hypothetical protein ACFWNG_18530 [Streptomyces sp. NPDC058391]|uniref:hypothetical protein n=1 Tax=Streptomyces sp. NPDC058391 TaxID=3346476 RepID=UPI003655B337